MLSATAVHTESQSRVRQPYHILAPISVMLYGQTYQATYWSLSGFRIDSLDPVITFMVGDVLDVHVSVSFQGFEMGFGTAIRVLRFDKEAHSAEVEFQNLDQRSLKILIVFIENVVREDINDVGSIIRRLEAPISPVTLEPQPDANIILNDEQQSRKRKKGIFLYSIASLLLAVVLASVIYTTYFQLRIGTAVVMGMNDVLLAPASGPVIYNVSLNQEVEQGASLASLNDPKLDYQINIAELKSQTLATASRQQEALLQLEKGRLSSAGSIVSRRLQASRNLVESLEKSLEARKEAYQKIEELQARGLATQLTAQKFQTDYFEAERQLNDATLNLVTLEQQQDAIDQGFQVHDQYVQNSVGDRAAASSAARENLAQTNTQISFLQNQKKALTLFAPSKGRLVRLFTPPGGTARMGAPLAVFERAGKRYIQAFLTQSEALRVSQGQKAYAWLPPALGRFPVRVVDIDLYSLTLNRDQGHFQWANLLNDQFKTVIVYLEPVNEEDVRRLANTTSGAAAKVVF